VQCVLLCVPCRSLATPPSLQQPSVDPSPAQSPMSVDSDAIGNEAALDVQRRVSASSDQNDVSKPPPLANGKMYCVCLCVCLLHVYACMNGSMVHIKVGQYFNKSPKQVFALPLSHVFCLHNIIA